jgi:hypothetical protein
MFLELNIKYALQLDISPIMGWSCQNLAGGNHSIRLIDHLESSCNLVIDTTVPRYEIFVADLAADLEEKVAELDPE